MKKNVPTPPQLSNIRLSLNVLLKLCLRLHTSLLVFRESSGLGVCQHTQVMLTNTETHINIIVRQSFVKTFIGMRYA